MEYVDVDVYTFIYIYVYIVSLFSSFFTNLTSSSSSFFISPLNLGRIKKGRLHHFLAAGPLSPDPRAGVGVEPRVPGTTGRGDPFI